MALTYQLAPFPNWQEWIEVTIDSNPDVFEFTADTVTNAITILDDPSGSNHYFTGKAVRFSTVSGTLPSPLLPSATYYLIFLTSTTFKVASTYNNAISNTPITLTTNGSGSLFVQAAGQVFLQPNANGKIYTYSSQDHTVNKPTYTDSSGITQNANPIILNNKGQATIYWAVNDNDNTDNYYIEVYTSDDVLVYATNNFNAAFPATQPTEQFQIVNFARNSMFSYWGLYDYNNVDVVSPLNQSGLTNPIETAYEWFYVKNNTSSTAVVSRGTFTAGQVEVPNNPVYYLNYNCTIAGSGETYSYFYQPYDSAQTFSGETVSFSIYMQSAFGTSPMVTISGLQYFGSGGSASIPVTGQTFTINNTWTEYKCTLSFPTISGKTLGAGNNVQILINVPLNSTSNIKFSRVIENIGSTLNEDAQLTLEEQKQTLTVTGETAEIKIFPNVSNPPRTWIALNGTIGNTGSNATYHQPMCKSLYLYLWGTYDNAICPVYTSAGAPTSRGASALADFNANVAIALWFNSGRVISNTGAPNYSLQFTVTTSSAILTVTDPDNYAQYNLFTGTEIRVTTTGTLPAPLAINTSYYIIPVTATTYSLASSRQNALDGTAISNFSTSGTGIQTISIYNTYSIGSGEALGEQSHTQTTTELTLHTHGSHQYTATATPHTGGYTSGTDALVENIPNAGSSSPMNIMQPTLGLPYIIKL